MMMPRYEPSAKAILVSWCCMAAFVAAVVLFFSSCAAAQTLTNADLGKKLHRPPASADVYAALKAHEYQSPPVFDAYGPVIIYVAYPTSRRGRQLSRSGFTERVPFVQSRRRR